MQRLREGDVRRVIGREVVAELPDPIEHREGPVASDPQPTKCMQDLPAAVFVQFASTDMSAHCVGDLRIDQMGHMNVLINRSR